MTFRGKKIVIAVCGSVSAYVACEVVDYLTKQEADVQVLMTENATKFVSELTFKTLSHKPVVCDLHTLSEAFHIPHIDVTAEADYIFVLPATATTMAKVAQGMADNPVTASILSASCPVYFAPTMNVKMYAKAATQNNLTKLKEMGYHIIEPAEGKMICGAVGPGKMQSAEYLCAYISDIVLGKDKA
jgi:phosphopantothenoylcysteine decarboxylase/phosphopantothenate--cysteine ligase